MYNIKELLQSQADLVKANGVLLKAAEDEKRDLSDEEIKTYDGNMAKLKKLKPDIARVNEQIDEENSLSRGAQAAGEGHRIEVVGEPEKKFASFGEQLMAVVNAGRPSGSVDQRLLAAITGASEKVPSDGGFLVQQDFASELLKKTYELGAILSRVKRVPISSNANSIKFLRIIESTRATGSRWGGVQVYRADEAGTATAKNVKFGTIELTLKKLLGLSYLTDELLEDAAALEAITTEAFSNEFMFTMEDEIIRGSSAEQMQGILNAPCLVTQAKETGQEADTVVYENINKMWSRCWAKSRGNAVWLVNQEVEPQLNSMSLIIGTGGVPVYLPPGGLTASPYGSLFGRPVIAVEYASALGDVGDVILADFSQYLMIEKGGLKTASSVHVKFVEGEMTFRFTLRNAGQPLWATALTPYKGASTKTLSPFVTLAARA